MFATRSTHKRKRSAARRDAAHEVPIAGRVIASTGTIEKGKGRANDELAGRAEAIGSSRLGRIARGHPFNHQITVTATLHEGETVAQLLKSGRLPDPNQDDDCIPPATFARVALTLFLDVAFATAFIKRGRLTALARGRLDVDDVFCLDGLGKLHLNLTRQTYQTLGLVGQAFKQSNTSSGRGGDRRSGRPERYLVTIDLRAPYFVPGKPAYEQTRERLHAWDAARSHGTDNYASWDVLFQWTDGAKGADLSLQLPESSVRPGSARCIPTVRHVRELDDVWIPRGYSDVVQGWDAANDDDDGSTSKQHDWAVWIEQAESLAEWMSLCELSAECVRTFWRPDHVNGYEVMSPRTAGSVAVITYQGFLTSAMTANILGCAHRLAVGDGSAGESSLRMITIRATGFADAPVAWLPTGKNEMPTAPTPPSLVTQGAFANDAMDRGEVSEPESECDVPNSGDDSTATGKTARRKRNKARQKRGHTNSNQLGHQVTSQASSPASASGWLIVLDGRAKGQDGSTDDDSHLNWLAIENVGATLRS